jgi:tetratricopeptide (TPR) repeat protein
MQIYITRDGQQLGPFDENAVQAGLRDGSLLSADLAWYDGASGWVPLATVPGLVTVQPVPVIRTPPKLTLGDRVPPIIYKLAYGFTMGVSILLLILRFLPSSQSVNNDAVDHAKKGEYDQAIADYTKAIKKWGGKDYLYYNRSLSYKGKKDYDKAILDLTEALRLNPQYVEAYSARADAYDKKADYVKALADYDRAIRLKPDKASFYYDRAGVYKRSGDNDKAIADYDEYIRRDPKYAFAYLNRGILHNRKHEREKAIADYSEAIRLAPKDAVPYYDRALVYEATHDYERAMADFEQARQLDPKDPDACEKLAHLLASCPQAHLRDGTKAVIYGTKACELSGWKGGALNTLAAAYAEEGDFDQAMKWESKYLSTASESDKPDAQARLALYQKRKPYHMAM